MFILSIFFNLFKIFFNLFFRKAWILPHCLSTTSKVETVEFDAAKFNGGIIQPDKILPSDLGTVYIFKEWPGKTIYFNFDSIFGDFFLKFFSTIRVIQNTKK